MDLIAAAGDKLWKELVGTDTSRRTEMKITSVQLSFTGIESMESGQKMIEGFFGGKPQVNTKPSSSSGKPASIAQAESPNSNTPRPTSAVGGGGEGSKPRPPKRKRTSSSANNDRDRGDKSPTPTADVDESGALSFVCDQCGQRVALSPDDVSHAGDADATALSEIREVRLEQLHREHADFHFAENLANEPAGLTLRPGSTTANGSSSGNGDAAAKKRKKPPARNAKEKGKAKDKGKGKDKEAGIAKFFTQK